MRYTPLLAGTAAALAIRSTSDNITCTDSLYVLVGRGTNEAPGPGVSGALADKIAEKVKGTVVGAVNYPAKWSDPNYFVSESEGAKAVSDEIKQYTDKCPKAKIAYLGYSQGAQIGSDALCGNDNALFSSLAPFSVDLVEKYLIAGVVYGDPSHNITAPFNKGTATTNGLFPRKDFSKCEKYTDRFVAYCDAGDVYCASGNQTAVHGMYISKYGDEIVQYIVDHYNKATSTTPSGNNATTTGSNGGSSATATASGSGSQASGSSSGANPTGSSTPKSAAAGLQAKVAYAALPLAMLGAAMQLL